MKRLLHVIFIYLFKDALTEECWNYLELEHRRWLEADIRDKRLQREREIMMKELEYFKNITIERTNLETRISL